MVNIKLYLKDRWLLKVIISLYLQFMIYSKEQNYWYNYHYFETQSLIFNTTRGSESSTTSIGLSFSYDPF